MTMAQESQPAQGNLACAEILRIAQQDAQQVYRDLSGLKITLVLEPDGWHVDYDLTGDIIAGGGRTTSSTPTMGRFSPNDTSSRRTGLRRLRLWNDH
ncbi:MAG TPA: hypothetical protein VKD72_25015 [Gemmataceae bacterium]|nr:hypothetical protein [Gemmataceae bacterium]